MLVAQHRPVASALTDGYHLAFWISCGLVVAAAVVTATVLRRPAPQPSAEPSTEPSTELVPAYEAC